MVDKKVRMTATYSEKVTVGGCREFVVRAFVTSGVKLISFTIDFGDQEIKLNRAGACALEDAIHNIKEAIDKDICAEREGCQ